MRQWAHGRLSGAAERPRHPFAAVLSAAPGSAGAWLRRTAACSGMGGSIVFARSFPVVLDRGASCFFVPALFFLCPWNFCSLALFGDSECCREKGFEPEPCQLPIPGQTAGFFGNNHNFTGGKRHKQPFPNIIGEG